MNFWMESPNGRGPIRKVKPRVHKLPSLNYGQDSMGNRAIFVPHPRTVFELMEPPLSAREREFVVVRVIYLSEIDYENFCSDMLVARDYLEENASVCFERGSIGCLMITTFKYRRDSILVLPDDGPFVKLAAYYDEGAKKESMYEKRACDDHTRGY